MPSSIGVINMPISLVYQKVDALAYRFTCEIQIKIIFRGGNVTTTETMKNLDNIKNLIEERDGVQAYKKEESHQPEDHIGCLSEIMNSNEDKENEDSKEEDEEN